MIEIEFSSAIVSRREDGQIAIALMDGLPAPFEGERVCVALLICSDETAVSMCVSISAVLKANGT